MISHAQHVEKLERVKKVIDTFLSYEDISINELSKITKISSSTIQRDLNDLDYIRMVYGGRSKEVFEKISERLKKNRKNGLSRGGTISTTNNIPTRDENGKFTGNKKR